MIEKYSTSNSGILVFHKIFKNWFSFAITETQKDWASEWFIDIDDEVEMVWELNNDIP